MKTRRSLSLVLAALCCSVAATRLSAQASSTTPASEYDETVKMSQFVVNTTKGMGYVDANSVSGFKTNQSLLDIPQAELVLTQDFLQDIPFNKNLSDVLQFVGVNSFYRSAGFGEGTMIRGSRVSIGLTDGMIGPGWVDSDFIDTLEVLKGTASALYQGIGTTGALLKTTKKPLQTEQNSLTLTVDSQGLRRAVLDSTGPAGTLGEARIAYRIVAGAQEGGQYFAHDQLKIWDVHPSFQIDYRQTSLLVAYDFEHFQGTYNSQGVLTPTGDIFKAIPRKYEGLWLPKQDQIQGENRGVRVVLDQKISSNWEMRLSAIDWSQQEFGGNAVVTGVNYQTNTFSGIFRQNNAPVNQWQLLDDIVGKYSIGPVKCVTTLGFAHSDLTADSLFWTTTRPGLANTFILPLGPTTPQAIDATYLPQLNSGDYTVPPNPGTRTKTYQDLMYAQEQVDVIPNWVSLIAGAAFIQTEAITDTNINTTTPYVASDIAFHAWIPRYGAIVHVTKEISVYALDSKNAAVQSTVDANNARLPNIQITSKEVGIKSALLDGRLVADVAYFRTEQSNQSVFSGFINSAGVGYYLPVGTTQNKGFDASIFYALMPGWQIIATGYKGTVFDQNGHWISPSYGNSWSLFSRFDLPASSPFKGFGFGGGIARIGERYLTTGPLTFPAGWVKPAYIKIHEGTNLMLFMDYHFLRRWDAHLSCANVLDQNYPIGTQSVAAVDPSPPRTFTFSASYTF
jgi:iron complex outermembrane receptor protein